MTKTDWTAEEVWTNLCAVERVRNNIHSTYKSLPEEWHDWALEQVAELTCAVDFRKTLTAFANRIEADERAVSVACNHSWMVAGQADHHFTCSKCGEISNGKAANSPAQPAQVDKCCCGEPSVSGVRHRSDGPCHLSDADGTPAQEQPGWKWVPVEPSAEWVGAYMQSYGLKSHATARTHIRKMLAACPTPPKEK